MPEGGEMDERLVNRRCAPQQHRGMTAHGTLHENRRHGAEGFEFTVEASRRQDHEPVDVVREGPGDLDLFLRMFARIREQHLQLGLAGRALDGTNHGGKVRIGDVGDDDRDVARPTRLHDPSGTVRHKSELLHSTLDPLRVAGATFSGRLNARDTVAGCTLARAATLRIVTRLGVPTAFEVTRRNASFDHDRDDRDRSTALRPHAWPGTDGGGADLRQNGAGKHCAPWTRCLRSRPSRRLRRRSVSAGPVGVDPRHVAAQQRRRRSTNATGLLLRGG